VAAYLNRAYRTHPKVRQFVLARGRTRTRTRHPLMVHTLVSAAHYAPTVAATLTPQERAVYDCTHRNVSVAEVSAHTGLSLGLVRVILGDLASSEAITIHPATESFALAPDATRSVLEKVLHGLQQL
jgi:hypothetical protein